MTGAGENSAGTLVEDLPAAVFLRPVLHLAYRVREVVRAIVLVEADYREVALAWVAKHGEVRDSDLDPALAGIDLLLARRPGRIALAVCAEAPGIVAQVARRVAALPVGAPGLNRVRERFAVLIHGGGAAPLDLVGDDHRRQPDLDKASDLLEVRVCEHDASVAGAGRPAVSIGRSSVQPDPVPVAAHQPVPRVRVVDGKGARA